MSTSFRICFFASVMAALPLMAGCSHKKTKPDNEETYAATAAASSDPVSSDLGNAYGLQTIHFSFDSNLLDQSAKSELDSNAQVLMKNPAVKIQVEGYCDNRGGIQYNIALGERRAQEVKHYLQDRGVGSERISTISYGKERPLDTADTEEAYAKNRRANFVVTHGLM
jgi:peptidoglycan-associated lipoprotein